MSKHRKSWNQQQKLEIINHYREKCIFSQHCPPSWRETDTLIGIVYTLELLNHQSVEIDTLSNKKLVQIL